MVPSPSVPSLAFIAGKIGFMAILEVSLASVSQLTSSVRVNRENGEDDGSDKVSDPTLPPPGQCKQVDHRRLADKQARVDNGMML
ncbi:hypothetical protein BaRGS_00016021 [Batillaria attramentaria]|uniref:Uncharacterized protein n=1 Tax=Batillaria attramentaria TaxID=370345 RepID=A0ABD0KZP4_9CAEN